MVEVTGATISGDTLKFGGPDGRSNHSRYNGMAASGASGAAGILVRYLAVLQRPMPININPQWHGRMPRLPNRTKNML